MLRAGARRLGAALAAVAELEGSVSWRTSGPGCGRGDRLRGVRAEHGRGPGGTGVEGLVSSGLEGGHEARSYRLDG